MPRIRIPGLAARSRAWLLAALCVAAIGVDAQAQLVPPDADPLAPRTADPRNPPRLTQPGVTPLVPPLVFTPPPSGAGDTGFDATNARKAKAKENANAKPKPKSTDAIASTPAPLPISPYQKPPTNSANNSASNPAKSAYAMAPGDPPVDIGPIRRKPTKRKAHVETDDPYAPLGVKSGGFIFFPAIEFISGYNTNPEQVPGGKGAWLYTVAPEVLVQSDWSRHELKADLRGSYNGFSPDATPSLNRPYFSGKADGRVDVTHDTRIDLSARALVSTDNPGRQNLQADLAKLPIYVTTGGNVGLGQRFNRFDFSVKADAERTTYQQSKLTDGTMASNEDRNYNQFAGILRGGYELSPGVKPFAEVTADTRKHDLETDFSGYQRNSNGLTGTVGSTFELTRLLTGEVGIGYTQRKYADARLEPVQGLIGDASLIWTASALTTAKLTGKSSVGESTLPGVSGTLSRDIGLQVDHSFRRWLIGSVKLGFGYDDYVGFSREDKRFSAGLGLTYKLNRSAQIKGEFRQDWLRSNVTGVDY
ncbi:MAG TPA: outer membrane beta-barrel protein, partial [Pseudolabrys sp.]